MIHQKYLDNGWALCAIKPNSKQPAGNDWQNKPRKSIPKDHGVGLIHQHSGTCSLDLDDMEGAKLCLAAIGVDLDELMNDGVQIISREGRGKLLYKAPEGLPTKRHNINWPGRGCIIEFRAGLVQDVLPPSIHPDTGKPYEWRGDWQNLPELPPQLVKAWHEWDLAKAAMKEADPNFEPPRISAEVRPRSIGQGEGIIDKFNQAYDPLQILNANGYIQCGKRWLSPHSSTMIPGIVKLEEGLIYCHHGSDPLGDGYAHDAFSVYTVIEHGGDMIAAVKTAAGLFEDRPDPEVIRMGEVIQMKPKPKKLTGLPAIPCDELVAVQKWIAKQLPANKPDAVLMAAVSFACAMTGRRYIATDGQPTNIFAGMVDTSTAALRPIKGAVYLAATLVGERQILRGNKLSSSTSLHKALIKCPRFFWATDELGHMIRMARVQQSGALESIVAALHEAYIGHRIYIDHDIDPVQARGQADDFFDVRSPSVSVQAYLSEDQLSHLARRSEYGRGTLQQMIVIPAGDSLDDHWSDQCAELPRSIIDRVAMLAAGKTAFGAKESHGVDPAAVQVREDAEGRAVMQNAVKRLRSILEVDELQQYRGMAIGYWKTAQRIAAALAAWRCPDKPVVGMVEAEWAVSFACYCLERTAPLLAVSGQGEDPDIVDQVQRLLIDAGDKGYTERELVQRCRALRKMSGGADGERQRMLEQMHSDGLLQIRKTRSKSNRYFDKSIRLTVQS